MSLMVAWSWKPHFLGVKLPWDGSRVSPLACTKNAYLRKVLGFLYGIPLANSLLQTRNTGNNWLPATTQTVL